MDAEDADEALDALNGIIEQTQVDKLLSFYTVSIFIPMVSHKIVYSIGPSSFSPDVSAARPMELLRAYSTRQGSDLPASVITKDDYDSLQRKNTEVSGWIRAAYYEASYPLGNIYVYPEPVDTLTTLVVTARANISTFSSLDDVLSLPPLYVTWLQYKVAERLAPEYGLPFTAILKAILLDVESSLKRGNIRPFPVSRSEAGSLGGGGRYNIFSDVTGRP